MDRFSIYCFFSIALFSHVYAGSKPNCSQGHCTAVGAVAMETCQDNADILGLDLETYKSRGGAAVTSENGRVCQCPCSCVVAETLIGTEKGQVAIKDLEKDSKISTPLAKNSFASMVSLMASSMENLTVQKTSFSNGTTIVSSPNHTFITPNEMIISAEKLKNGDRVMGAKGDILTVVASPEKGMFDGTLYNLIVSKDSQVASDHVLDTEGVLSGDWMLQSTNDLVEEELFLRTAVVELLD